MKRHLSHYETTYRPGDRPAYQIPWSEVTEILGHEHDGSQEDDASLIAALAADGAKPVRDGWIDEAGWGVFVA